MQPLSIQLGNADAASIISNCTRINPPTTQLNSRHRLGGVPRSTVIAMLMLGKQLIIPLISSSGLMRHLGHL